MIDLDKFEEERPERLPSSHCHWSAITTRTDGSKFMLYGTMNLGQPTPTDVIARTRVLGYAAAMANEIDIQWDPFNVRLAIKPFSPSTK